MSKWWESVGDYDDDYKHTEENEKEFEEFTQYAVPLPEDKFFEAVNDVKDKTLVGHLIKLRVIAIEKKMPIISQKHYQSGVDNTLRLKTAPNVSIP